MRENNYGLVIKIGELIYQFTHLSRYLSLQIKKYCGDFVLSNYNSSFAPKKFICRRNFDNIWSFKTFFKKKLSRDLLVFNKLMVHSAAFVFKKKTFVFLGESGQGKSTLIRKVKKYTTILNDETNIIDIDKLLIFPTPFWGEYNIFSTIHYNIDRIFVLKKSNKNHIKRMPPKVALYSLLKTVMVDINSDKIKYKVFDIACQLISKTPFYQYSYSLNTDLKKLLNQLI